MRLLPFLLLATASCLGQAPTEGRLVTDLPVIEAPAPSGDALVVFLSGDGGWAALMKGVTAELNAADVAVVGLDARRFLSEERTPEEVADAVSTLVATYAGAWGRSRVLLVGFSRGANLAVVGGAHLPDSVQRQVAGVVLLAPGTHEKFRFRFLDLVRETAAPTGVALAPLVPDLAPLPVRCVYGTDEAASLCPLVAGGRVDVRPLPGGHHLGRDYRTVAGLVLDALERWSPLP